MRYMETNYAVVWVAVVEQRSQAMCVCTHSTIQSHCYRADGCSLRRGAYQCVYLWRRSHILTAPQSAVWHGSIAIFVEKRVCGFSSRLGLLRCGLWILCRLCAFFRLCKSLPWPIAIVLDILPTIWRIRWPVWFACATTRLSRNIWVKNMWTMCFESALWVVAREASQMRIVAYSWAASEDATTFCSTEKRSLFVHKTFQLCFLQFRIRSVRLRTNARPRRCLPSDAQHRTNHLRPKLQCYPQNTAQVCGQIQSAHRSLVGQQSADETARRAQRSGTTVAAGHIAQFIFDASRCCVQDAAVATIVGHQ